MEAPGQAKVDFDIPLVGPALGGSLIHDECKGNFAAARTLAETALAAAGGSTEAAAEALLALGVVQLLQGDILQAQSSLHRAEAGTLSPDLRCFAFACGHLAQFHRYRLAPGGGLFTLEIEQLWNGIEFANTQNERFKTLFAAVTSDVSRMQSAFIFNVLAMIPVQLQVLDTNATSLKPEKLQELCGQLLGGTLQFQQAAANGGARLRILAFADVVVAEAARRAGRFDVASATIGRAAQAYLQDGDGAGYGAACMRFGDWNAAPSSLPLVWNMFLKEGAGDGSNLSWIDEAREGRMVGADVNRAREAYSAAREAFSREGALRGIAALMLREAYLSFLNDDPTSAAGQFDEAHDVAVSAGDHLTANLARLSAALSRVGISHRYEDESTALSVGQWGAQSGSTSYACGLGLLAGRVARHWLLRRGDYQRAAAGYRMARALFEGLDMVFHHAQSFLDLGSLHAAVGNRYGSIDALENASTGFNQAGSRYPALGRHVARCDLEIDLRLYRLYESVMDADGIDRVAARLEEKLVAVPEPVFESGGIQELLRQYLADSELKEPVASDAVMDSAIQQHALSVLETARVTARLYRANKNRAAGRIEQASSEFAAALQYARSARVASRDFLEATVLAHQRDFDGAVSAFRRYVAAGGSNAGFIGKLLDNLAANSATGDAERTIQDQRTEEQSAGFMLRCRHYADAKDHFERIESAAGPDWWRRNDAPWETASDYGETLEGLQDFAKALDWYDRGIDAFERNRRLLTNDELKIALANQTGSRYLYFNASRAALKCKHAAEARSDSPGAESWAARAFAYAEAGRARALLDLLVTDGEESDELRRARGLHAGISASKGLLGQLIERGAPKEQMAELEQRIAEEEETLVRAERQLVESGGSAALDPRGEVVELGDLARQLEAGRCVLQYFFMAEDLLIWVISARGMIASRHLSIYSSELTYAIDRVRSQCQSQMGAARSAHELAKTLIEPVRDVLANFDRVLIVPHGAAHHLPFHLLPFDDRLFGQSHIISYLPSASILHYFPDRWRGLGDDILVVGNPANMAKPRAPAAVTDGAAPLPFAATESTAIASMFEHSTLLLRDQATRGRLLQSIGRHRVIHFATHGYLDANEPSLSALLLSNGENLNVVELSALRLDADIVVLSACDSGRGKATGGDDVLGLARAFLVAGARFLIVSLWPVDDLASMVFMVHFYRRLKSGLDPAAAMRDTQDALRRLSLDHFRVAAQELIGAEAAAQYSVPNWGRPYYWAPFVVIGKQ